MNPTSTTSEIIEEVRKLQYFFKLKQEIRYKHERTIGSFDESVADHVYAMHVVAQYFLPLVDPEQTLDRLKIYEMITWHDSDEIETGDTISWKKTQADIEHEKEVSKHVAEHAPEHLQARIAALLEEYENLTSEEAKFVKAIDKVEPIFHLYTEEGKDLSHKIGLTSEAFIRTKEPYASYYPTIKHFKDTMHEVMINEGYFVE